MAFQYIFSSINRQIWASLVFVFSHFLSLILPKSRHFIFFNKKIPTKFHLLIIFCNLLYINANAWQVPITNYTQNNYAAGTQNWQFAIGRNGWIYAANNYGLLEFDGLRWKLYGIRNGGSARSVLATATTDTIYVAGENEYGFFVPTENGSMRYTSLSDEASSIYGHFGSVWNIMRVDNDIYFQARNHIFIHEASSGKLHYTVQSDNYILSSVQTQQNIYIARNNGLFEITDHNIATQPLAGTQKVGSMDICCLCTNQNGNILIGTKNNGIFCCTPGIGVQQLSTIANEYTKQHQLYNIAHQGELTAYATVTGGLMVENNKTGLTYIANTNNGLQNNTVLSLQFDDNSILWCGLDVGIDRLNINSPITELCNWQNSIGTGYAFYVKDNDIYLGTNRALYHTQGIDVQDLSPADCHIVNGSVGQVWGIYPFDNKLFCCHDKGLYLINDNNMEPICTTEGFWKIEQLPNANNIAIAGSYSGLYIVRRSRDGYVTHQLQGISSSCKTFQVDKQGYVWLSTDDGIERLSIDLQQENVNRELKMPQLQANNYMNLSKIGNTICISQGENSFVVDANNKIDANSELLSSMLGNDIFYSDIKQDAHGNTWFIVDDALYAKNAITSNNIVQIWNVPRNNVYGFISIVPIDSATVVVNTVDGFALGKIPNAINARNRQTAHSFIRQINSLAPQSATCYYSHNASTATPIPYSDNSVRISYGSMECCNSHTEFSYALATDDNEPIFSEWTVASEKEYTFLPPGHYTFYLRMRLDNKTIADERSLSFEVLPPWWQTWWARMLWYILSVAAISGIIYTSHLRNERKRRRIITANEEEMARQQSIHEKEMLAAETEMLRVRNEKVESELKNKSEELSGILLSNVSRNELIQKIKHDLLKIVDDLQQKDNKGAIKRIAIMQDKLSSYQEEKVNWKRFEDNFDEVNGRFIQKLQSKYPWLTDNEKRLCVYIQAGLMSKEIAPLMSITVRGVEMMRYRMRKKMELPPDTDLDMFLRTINS